MKHFSCLHLFSIQRCENVSVYSLAELTKCILNSADGKEFFVIHKFRLFEFV